MTNTVSTACYRDADCLFSELTDDMENIKQMYPFCIRYKVWRMIESKFKDSKRRQQAVRTGWN